MLLLSPSWPESSLISSPSRSSPSRSSPSSSSPARSSSSRSSPLSPSSTCILGSRWRGGAPWWRPAGSTRAGSTRVSGSGSLGLTGRLPWPLLKEALATPLLAFALALGFELAGFASDKLVNQRCEIYNQKLQFNLRNCSCFVKKHTIRFCEEPWTVNPHMKTPYERLVAKLTWLSAKIAFLIFLHSFLCRFV